MLDLRAVYTILFLSLAAPVSYFYVSSRPVYIVSAALVPALILAGAFDTFAAVLCALLFAVFQLSVRLCKSSSSEERRDAEKELGEEIERKRALEAEVEGYEAEESEAKDDELLVVSLFEITKKMSEKLRFIEIFDVFSAFLKSNFSFRKCDLLILGREESVIPRLERVYSVWQEGSEEESKQIANYDKLIRNLLNNPQKIHASKDADRDMMAAMGIEDPGVSTFTAIPLVSDDSLAAILTVENMPKESLEKFLILSMQFALEIKKVLLYEKVERLAITDSLTSLYLRRYFYDRLTEELQRSKRYGFGFTFMMIDIDDFKKANDTYGHLVGDVILKELARLIKESVREIDLVSRYGGEEFAIVLPETSLAGALLVAERLRKRVEEHTFRAYDETLKITISLGLSVFPEDSGEADDLIEKADRALYKAKRTGKNVVCKYGK